MTARQGVHWGEERKILTPRQRLRQLEPSLLVRGQTTSLLASETENELVSEDRGGMVMIMYLCSHISCSRWGGEIVRIRKEDRLKIDRVDREIEG